MKPTVVKKLQGTLQPCRTNPYEPVPVGVLGDPPRHLSAEERAVWVEISESIAPGVATSSDMHLVEVVARCMVKFRAGTIKGFEMAAMMKGLAELGMTPASRSRIIAKPKDDAKGKWA